MEFPMVNVLETPALLVITPLPVKANVVRLNVLTSIVPDVRSSVPPIVVFAFSVVVPDAMVRFELNAPVPEIVWAVPLKITTPVAPLTVPLLVQLPLTVKVFVPVMVSVAPELMVILLQTAAAEIVGWNGVPARMVTLSVAVGTIPPHQFAPSNQSTLAAPNHEPVLQDELLTLSIPVPAAK